MKKYFIGLIVILFSIFVPSFVNAEESYEYFDFKVERIDGSKIKDTLILVYSSVESNPKELKNRTDEFNFVEVVWSECVTDDCLITQEVNKDAVFEEGKDYLLMIKISAKNKADIDVWGIDKVMYNGTPIEELFGEFGNTGKELMIKTKTNITTSKLEDTPATTIENPSPVTKNESKVCMLNSAICCSTFLNLSICIWILITAILILLIIIICVLKNRNKQDEPKFD